MNLLKRLFGGPDGLITKDDVSLVDSNNRLYLKIRKGHGRNEATIIAESNGIIRSREDQRIDEENIGDGIMDYPQMSMNTYLFPNFDVAPEDKYLIIGYTHVEDMKYLGKVLDELKEYSDKNGIHILMDQRIYVINQGGDKPKIDNALLENDFVLVPDYIQKGKAILGETAKKTRVAKICYKTVPSWQYNPISE